MATDSAAPVRYFVSHKGEVKGPLDLDMIEAFVLSGYYPQGVQICAEGSREWNNHSFCVKAEPPPLPQQASQPVGTKPNDGVPKWVLWSGGIVALLILLKLSGGSQTSRRSASPSPIAYSTPIRTRTVTDDKPLFDSSKSFTLPSPNKYHSTPISVATPADVLYQGTNGRTYSVPHSAYLRLSKERAAIDEEDRAIRVIQANEEAQSASIEYERAYLDRTDQDELDAFNAKIDNINAVRMHLKQRINTLNRRIDAFNAELERVGTLVR